MKDIQLSVILPTLNEEGNIGVLIDQIRSLFDCAEILVVDDHSSDRTAEVVKQKALVDPLIVLIERKGVPSLTASIQEGVKRASGQYIAWMDADLSHPPDVLPKLLENARLNQCSIATRFALGGQSKKVSSENHGESPLAILLSNILNALVQRVLGIEVTDYTSGFIVCKASLLKPYFFVGDYGEYFIALLFYLTQKNVKIFEVPYVSPPRVWGQTKTGATFAKLIQRGIKYLWLTLKICLDYYLGTQLMQNAQSKKALQQS